MDYPNIIHNIFIRFASISFWFCEFFYNLPTNSYMRLTSFSRGAFETAGTWRRIEHLARSFRA